MEVMAEASVVGLPSWEYQRMAIMVVNKSLRDPLCPSISWKKLAFFVAGEIYIGVFGKCQWDSFGMPYFLEGSTDWTVSS